MGGPLLALAVLLGASKSYGQQSPPVSADGILMAAWPTGDFSDGADAGIGIGVRAAYHVSPMVAVRAGYSYQRFGADDGVDLLDSGSAIGPMLTLPINASTAVVLHVDAVLHRISVSASEGGIGLTIDSDRALGFEVGAGLDVATSPRVSIVPRIGYRQYDATFDLSEFGSFSGNVTAAFAGLGVSVRP